MSSIAHRFMVRSHQGHNLYRRCYGVRAASQESCPFSDNKAVEEPDEVVKSGMGKEIKPFEAIPGPRALPFGLGTLHKYLPYIGEYSFKHMHHSGRRKYEEFGPIVRENITADVNLLFLFDPKVY
ncbi:unnamed protein product, partial [Meganyctiphanes norvegica]